MKNNVTVLHADDVEFGRLRWWSNWVDVAVFTWLGKGYLLQMSISRRNSKRFKSVKYGRPGSTVHISHVQAGDLLEINRKIGGDE